MRKENTIKIIDVLHIINEKLETVKDLKKEDLKEDIEKLDALIKNLNIKGDEEEVPEFIKKMEVRWEQEYQNAKTNRLYMDASPACGIFFAAQYATDKLRNFLSKYNIGHLAECYLDQCGSMKAVIRTIIMPPSSFDKEYSSNMAFALQKQILKDRGIEIIDVKKLSTYLSAEKESMDNVRKLLSKIGGNISEYEVRHFEGTSFVSSMMISFDNETFFNSQIERLEVQSKIEDVFNEDEKRFIKKNISEFLNAYDLIQYVQENSDKGYTGIVPSYENMFGDVLRSCVYWICKTTKVQTEVSEEYEEKLKENRRKNDELRQLHIQNGERAFSSLKDAVIDLEERFKLTLEPLWWYEIKITNMAIELLVRQNSIYSRKNPYITKNENIILNDTLVGAFIDNLEPFFPTIEFLKADDVTYEDSVLTARCLHFKFDFINPMG